MLGTFQQSELRIEIEATQKAIGDSLLYPEKMQQWLPEQRFQLGMPEKLYAGYEFTSWTAGMIPVQHYVEIAEDNVLRLLLSQGIDGYHEWHWGEGWVQSRLEGVSVLPLNLGQTLSLMQLRTWLTRQQVLVS
jgi:hypothetical protein